jgi:hypothetical protein
MKTPAGYDLPLCRCGLRLHDHEIAYIFKQIFRPSGKHHFRGVTFVYQTQELFYIGNASPSDLQSFRIRPILQVLLYINSLKADILLHLVLRSLHVKRPEPPEV